MRRVRINLPIRNAHIYLCNSAGYQNELWCTKSQTVYTDGLGKEWATTTDKKKDSAMKIVFREIHYSERLYSADPLPH